MFLKFEIFWNTKVPLSKWYFFLFLFDFHHLPFATFSMEWNVVDTERSPSKRMCVCVCGSNTWTRFLGAYVFQMTQLLLENPSFPLFHWIWFLKKRIWDLFSQLSASNGKNSLANDLLLFPSEIYYGMWMILSVCHFLSPVFSSSFCVDSVVNAAKCSKWASKYA